MIATNNISPIINHSKRVKPSAEFRKEDFEQVMQQKGYDVIIEHAVRCPCKSKEGNQLSNCRNCGGSGWVFISEIKTKSIIHSMNLNTERKEWSIENRGTVNVSVLDDVQLSYMDRITMTTAEGYYSEVLHMNTLEDSLFSYTSYNISDILYASIFKGVSEKLTVLKEEDYFIERNIFFLNENFLNLHAELNEDLSVAVRYKHKLQFHIVDINREVMQSKVRQGGVEKVIDLPVSAVGQRAHIVLDAQNLGNDKILDNKIDLIKDKNC